MESTKFDTSREGVKLRLSNLSEDSRDISKVWSDAIWQYNKDANDHDKETLTLTTTPYFSNTQAMRKFGETEMQKFTAFRMKGEKITRLRQFFIKNIDFINTGVTQLVNAASASFPPAIVISTAMTFVLTGCKSVHADYDAIANFFEDMNNFFERVSIIGTRVPPKKAYQNALIDVFVSMLKLCAVARKFVSVGRFKTWIKSSVFGGDADLQSYREQMDNYLEFLQSATTFAILDNTENMLEQQAAMGMTLANLRSELDRNREEREQIAVSQLTATQQISDDVQTVLKDVKKLLALQQEAVAVKSQIVIKSDQISGNIVRHFYGFVLKEQERPFPDMLTIVANLEKSQIEGVGSWLFEDPVWINWVDVSRDNPRVLHIEGDPGTGKTYLSLSAYQQLCGLRNSDPDICVAYFSCHRPDEQRRHLPDLLRNCAIQIAEQNPSIRGKLEEKWRTFELHAGLKVGNSVHTKDNRAFIFDNFQEKSKNLLFVVINKIDEFDQVPELNQVIYHVVEQKLRIKFVITGNEGRIISSKSIHVGKKQISQDVRKILLKGINSEDSAYDSLRKLSRQCKRKMARTVEQNADNLLYVDQTLRFLADAAREGHDIEKLLDELPANLTALYEVIVQNFLRDLSDDQTKVLKSIFAWLTVSWHPLTTEWVNSLANSAGSLIGPQISSFVLQFFGIDALSGDATALLDIDLAELFGDSADHSVERWSPRDSLRLQAKNRSLKAFFSRADSKHKLRSTNSDAHRVIFLTAVDIILRRKTATPKSLYDYSIEHSLMHWWRIVPDKYTEEEQVEVCTAFFQLINDGGYADGLVKHGYCWCPSTIADAGWKFYWNRWLRDARRLPVSAEMKQYCQDDSIPNPLVATFVRYWLRNADNRMAAEAWVWAIGIESGRNIDKWDRQREFQKEEVLELARSLGTDLDSRAHFAIASVLLLEISDTASAIEQLNEALEKCREPAFRTRCHVQLASIFIDEKRWDDAVESCRLGLDSAAAPVQMSDIVGQREVVGNHDLQQSLRVQLLRMRAVAMRGLGMNPKAAESFCKARRLSTEVVPAEHLFNELSCLQERPTELIESFLDFKVIDQLYFLTRESYDLGGGVQIPPARIILPAIAKSPRGEEVVTVYREIIKALDTEQAAAPVRVDFAHVLWRLRHEKRDVRFLLNRVLDSFSEEKRYKLTDREPISVANSALLLMTDTLLEDFRSSRKVEDKVQVLLQAKKLPRRKFLASQPLITDAVWDPHSIAVAQMLGKIGPMSEYEQVMRKLFDKAMAGLSDDTPLNDSVYLISLSRILMMVPALRKLGETLYAVRQNPAVDKTDKNFNNHRGSEDTGYCNGICLPVTKFDHSSPLVPHYKCLICTDITLCQSCYDTRIQWNADSTLKDIAKPDFCCPNEHYMRIPMEGLRGVRDRMMEVAIPEEGVEATKLISFRQLLDDVKQAWEIAWEDIAFGIK